MPKRVEVCHDTPTLQPGETFEWTNSRDEDCVVTGCKPPLERASYHVPRHGSAAAKVDPAAVPNPPNHYPYQSECCHVEPQPKIIIGS
jgi:hypothetical protein